MTRIEQLLTLAQEELDTANLLLDNNRYRASVSRSYYAVYYATQALLDKKNLRSKSHKGVIQLFGQHFVKTQELSIDLARTLSTAYDLRKLSDYDETISITQQQAQTLLTFVRVWLIT